MRKPINVQNLFCNYNNTIIVNQLETNNHYKGYNQTHQILL